MKFPAYPTNNQDIWNYTGPGEYMAATIVKNETPRQVMAYRKIRIRLGEEKFRMALCEALDILSRSRSITNPAGWLYRFIAQEA